MAEHDDVTGAALRQMGHDTLLAKLTAFGVTIVSGENGPEWTPNECQLLLSGLEKIPHADQAALRGVMIVRDHSLPDVRSTRDLVKAGDSHTPGYKDCSRPDLSDTLHMHLANAAFSGFPPRWCVGGEPSSRDGRS